MVFELISNSVSLLASLSKQAYQYIWEGTHTYDVVGDTKLFCNTR